MALFIQQENLSRGWLEAQDALLHAGGTAVNVVVSIKQPTEEDEGIRSVLDKFILERRADLGARHIEQVQTVANTIFPEAWYRPNLGDAARQHLYSLHDRSRRVSKRRNPRGTYFGRMIAWPKGDGSEVNQLDRGITRLIGQRNAGRRVAHVSEIGLGGAEEVSTGDLAVSLPVYVPGRDNSIMGFPCLSHISITLAGGHVHMTAIYRNHEFMGRAYGNYLGLGRLLAFVARESGWSLGELVCISSHADAEVGNRRGFGRTALLQLVANCREAARA